MSDANDASFLDGMDASIGSARLHLVVKRGHRGRFRFVLIEGGEQIKGEVHIDSEMTNTADMRAIALRRIARLATSLIDKLKTQRSDMAPDVEEPS